MVRGRRTRAPRLVNQDLPSPLQKYFRQVDSGRSQPTRITRPPCEGATRKAQQGEKEGGAHLPSEEVGHLRVAVVPCGSDQMRVGEEVTMRPVEKAGSWISPRVPTQNVHGRKSVRARHHISRGPLPRFSSLPRHCFFCNSSLSGVPGPRSRATDRSAPPKSSIVAPLHETGQPCPVLKPRQAGGVKPPFAPTDRQCRTLAMRA